MAGLAALSAYESDVSSESDDEKVIDRVISTHKEDESEVLNEQHKEKTQQLELPLPSEILSMFSKSSSSEELSDPTQHQGKIRSFAHVPGNWATFVYVPAESSSLSNLVEILMDCLPADLTFNLNDDLHLSLSRTVCLQFHWIDIFQQSLSERMSGLQSFHCQMQRVDVYTNDEKTRTFLGLKIGAGHESLCDLVKLTDECLSEFALPTFYKNPSFHVSFCWSVGDVSARIDETVLQLLKDKLYQHSAGLTIRVKEVHCKSGCKKFVFPLR